MTNMQEQAGVQSPKAARSENAPSPLHGGGETASGRARSPSAPQPSPTARSENAPSLPVRKKIPHGPPPFPVSSPVVQFITINAAERGGTPFFSVATQLLESARFYHERGLWFLHLFLVMPDHLHMLASFPDRDCIKVCGSWKRYFSRTFGVAFQDNLFDHRIRDAGDFTEKWQYIRENPVRKGLVATAENWHWWIAFDPRTGAERCGNNVVRGRVGGRASIGR